MTQITIVKSINTEAHYIFINNQYHNWLENNYQVKEFINPFLNNPSIEIKELNPRFDTIPTNISIPWGFDY